MMMADGPILTFARSPSLAEQAAEAIVGGIAAGIFKPGERLVETNLAATLQMSRVPLREALKILEAQGIVASTPHRGTFIPTFDDNRVARNSAANSVGSTLLGTIVSLNKDLYGGRWHDQERYGFSN